MLPALLLPLLTLTIPALAQDLTSALSQIPACAGKALQSGISSSGCDLTDATCLCKAEGFQAMIQSEVAKDCSPADQGKILKFAEGLCGQVGVQLDESAPGSSSMPSSSTTATATATPSASGKPTGTVGSGGVGPQPTSTLAPFTGTASTCMGTSFAVVAVAAALCVAGMM